MLNIAVTGGIASGKSTVAKLFHEKFNIPIIDSDIIAKKIVNEHEELKERIIEKFGQKIVTENKLDRKKLREVIFSNLPAKKWLENLLHPLINQELREETLSLNKTNKHPYCLVLIPLVTQEYLTKNQFIDKVIVVATSQENQIQRASSRDQQTADEIKNIISHQLSSSERLKLADYIINNNSNLEDLFLEVQKVHQNIILAQ